MAEKKLTDMQRSALRAVEGARTAGLGLSEYARRNGLNARQIHDAATGLRKRGVLPPTSTAKRRRPKPAFMAVDVLRTVPVAGRTGMVCRLIHRSGLIIECGEWPPAAWLAAMIAERTGAAA